MINMSVVYVVVAVLLVRTASFADGQSIINMGACSTPNGESASCIDLEQCTFLFKMVMTPQLKNEDKLFLRRSQCGTTNGKVLVCCPNRYIEAQQPEIATRVSIPEPGVCGNLFENRIYGGNATKIDEYPWMALIEYDKGDAGLGHHCGGSLINYRYVLTAAHCVRHGIIPDTWQPVRVRLGEWDTSTDVDCNVDLRGNRDCAEPHVDVPIESIISHRGYVSSSKNQLHDIALIRLSRNVDYTDFIQPICLPVKDSLKNVSFDGIVMDVAGWGRTEAGTTSNVKLKAGVPGVPLTECQRVYGPRSVELQNSQMCAGGKSGVDSCSGDSGGALVASDTSNKLQLYNYIAGIISFGPTPCGLKGWPGVYTKVSHYIDWIQQNIQP